MMFPLKEKYEDAKYLLFRLQNLTEYTYISLLLKALWNISFTKAHGTKVHFSFINLIFNKMAEIWRKTPFFKRC